MSNQSKEVDASLPLPLIPWNKDEVFQISPTNAFGRMQFNVEQIGGQKPAKVFVNVLLSF